jgi:hypothetical protein
MMRYRLGILALREEISVFINDAFHFSIRDTVWPAGQLGIFARSAGDTPLTVSFSKLVVYRLKDGRPPVPTATPAPSLPPRATPTP